MKSKVQRQIVIRKVISENNIHSQSQLLQLVKLKGFDLTQATLSRDLKILKVAKIPDPDNGYRYIIPEVGNNLEMPSSRKVNILADGFQGIEFSENLGVIRTLPGYASSIASVIDSANPWEIIGTIAGDDTILIILREGISKTDIINTLIFIMPNLKHKLMKL